MLVLVGYVIVIGSVLGGFAMAGGHLGSIYQPTEVVIIVGAALGAFIVGNPMKTVKATFAALPTCFKGSRYDKAMAMELMSLLYDLLNKVRKEGLMSIERDIENPDESALFQWVETTRTLASGKDRAKIADQSIGRLLELRAC